MATPFLFVNPLAGGAATKDTDVIPDSVLVGFTGALPADVNAEMSKLGGDVVSANTDLAFVSVHVRDGNGAAFVARTAAVSGIKYAELDHRVHVMEASPADFTPNDPMYGLQWGPAVANMPAAWDVTKGSHSVMLAIVDTGIDNTHPDLVGNYCVRGPDETGGNWQNLMFHATHVMGIAAATIDNGVGVAGMSQSCIMDVRVLDSSGSGQWAWVANGITWAVDNGAKIISMSLGGNPGASAVAQAIDYAVEHNVLVVSAAGNSGCGGDTVGYPAKYIGSMAVAALSSASSTASFSSCGPAVEIAAPGENIWSTLPTSNSWVGTNYGYLSGTSMATPHVSGIAALLFAQNPQLTAADARCILDMTAKNYAGTTTLFAMDTQIGFGKVDAAAALAMPSCGPLVALDLAWAAKNHKAN
ncbi:MAG: S8 family serine peptidase [Thermoplasmatota archaeon]